MKKRVCLSCPLVSLRMLSVHCGLGVLKRHFLVTIIGLCGPQDKGSSMTFL